MAVHAFKHTNEALAFMTLFKSMCPEIKEEVRSMIAEESEISESEMFTTVSLQSWDAEEDGLKESEVWEKHLLLE